MAKLLVTGLPTKINQSDQELHVLVYPSAIDLSSSALRMLTRELVAHRRARAPRQRGVHWSMSDYQPDAD